MTAKNGTTPECAFIGGHPPGFATDCYWCVNAKQNAYGTSLFKDEHVFKFSRNWRDGRRLCGICGVNYDQGNHTEVRTLEPYTSYVCPKDTGQGHSSVWSGSQNTPELRKPTDNLCICGETFVKEDAEEWVLSWDMKDPWTGDWRPMERRGTQHSTLQQRDGLLTMPDEIANVRLHRAS